jgi:hypothetical protein
MPRRVTGTTLPDKIRSEKIMFQAETDENYKQQDKHISTNQRVDATT